MAIRRVDNRPLSATASLLPAAQRIAEISGLGANWDDEGASAPSALAYSKAFELLLRLEASDRSTGHVAPPITSAPIADGGLQIEWEGPQARIEIQAAPDGTFGYLIVKGGPGAREYEEADDLDVLQMVDVIQRTVSEE